MFLFVLLVVKVCPFGSLVGGLTLAAMCCVIKQQFPTSWQRLGFTVKQAENEYFCGGKFLISRTGLMVMCNKQKKKAQEPDVNFWCFVLNLLAKSDFKGRNEFLATFINYSPLEIALLYCFVLCRKQAYCATLKDFDGVKREDKKTINLHFTQSA